MSDVQSIHAEFTRWSGWPSVALDSGTTHWLDTDALAAALLDARTEAVALRATEENLRARVWAYESGEGVVTNQSDNATLVTENKTLRARLAALEAAAREGPSDAVLTAVMRHLDDFARSERFVGYGLPNEVEHGDAMRAIIRAALAKEP